MREIKFKAVIKATNEVFPVTTIWSNSVCLDLTDSEYEYDSKVFNNDEVFLLQYTGVNDKNSQEIYEGYIVSQKIHGPDPLEYGAFDGVVTMLEGQWVIDNEIDYCIPLWSEINENEVVGNIYKNPKLKEEK
ncbi:YopX family protein [Jeotgalibacillus terrae]|uniref:YopX family protein n=1 Tax=Jeotgalibacillus terrae TaxID=587735 RepID=A0ABW5ZEJ4_9BACL|nr:putative phage protein (TIGR01671 family) [Jeotgalibacillus terrae]